jgi:cyclic beta-1,2-glucan synthetase
VNLAESGLQPDPLEIAARELAELHAVSNRPAQAIAVWAHLRLLPQWLERAREASTDPPESAAKAAEWLLDNDYQVQRALQQVKNDLPAGFYARLPSLAGGDSDGLPRIFALAHGLLRASRLQLSLEGVAGFVNAYQEVAPLTIAELWALPTMLRLAGLEILVASFARCFRTLVPHSSRAGRQQRQTHSRIPSAHRGRWRASAASRRFRGRISSTASAGSRRHCVTIRPASMR